MAKLTPNNIVDFLLIESDVTAPPKECKQIVLERLKATNQAGSSAQLQEMAENIGKRVLRKLRDQINVYEEHGWPSRVQFNSSAIDYIQGSCFIEPKDNQLTIDQKNRRKGQSDYWDGIRNLDPLLFESLCAKTIQLLGCSDVVTTQRSADDGIDFFGRLRLADFLEDNVLQKTVSKQLNVWVVGQAKRYNRIDSSTSVIRDIFGAVTLAKSHASGSKQAPHTELVMRVADPVFTMLITSGRITKDAWRLIKASGVIGVDGNMLSAFLADQSVATNQATSNFDSGIFRNWIDS